MGLSASPSHAPDTSSPEVHVQLFRVKVSLNLAPCHPSRPIWNASSSHCQQERVRLELSGALGAASSASQQIPLGAVPVWHHEVLCAPHVLLLKARAPLPTPRPPPQLLGSCVEGGVLSWTAIPQLEGGSWV